MMLKKTLASAIIVSLCLFYSEAMLSSPPPPATGLALAIGLGVGLPFICSSFYNINELSRVLKTQFKFNPKLSKLKPVNGKTRANCPENVVWTNDENDAPCKANFFECVGLPQGDGKKTWIDMMGNPETPNGEYYALVAGKNKYSINLISNILKHQAGDAYISFKYWMTPPVNLNVCLLHKRSNFSDPSDCSKPISDRKNHEARVPIKGPIKKPFKIMIRSSNFEASQGSVVVVNKIKYNSNSGSCE